MRGKASLAFKKYCLDEVEKHERFCLAHGLMDGGRSLRLDVFRENFRKMEPDWAPGVSAAVSAASHFATIHEFLGDTSRARQYLWLGGHEWNYKDIDYPTMTGDRHIYRLNSPSDRIIRADGLVLQQLPAAVCSDRIGDRERARRLYGWVARLRDTSDGEYREFIGSFSGQKSHHEALGRKVERAYSLACLERWVEASAEEKSAQEWADRGPRPRGDHAWRNHFWLLPALRAVIDCKLNPSEKNKEAATKMLSPGVLRSKDHSRSLFLLFYLSNIKKLADSD